ncbi:GGDEF domain-containing protein [uncultured Sphingomonas sp.]|uniref:GGDEF domain-containing protein n=1 Tax=uncultured Sphingomonas sp. TaxID=158754 RepID=UPI0025FA6072|nr:GGDEF domain-containing protein [uncultured Sphingomonas sp.]
MSWSSERAGPHRPGVDAEGDWNAEHEAMLFLAAHRLERTPHSHALALYALRHPGSALGQEVARRTDGGVRLTAMDVESLRPLLRAHEEARRGHGEWQRDLGVQAERLESLTSDARQITRDLTSDMAALSDGPGTADTTDIAGLLAQLTTRITRTERELATLSGSIVALRERIDAASREQDVDPLTGVMSPTGARSLIAELPDLGHGYVLATCGLDDRDDIVERHGRTVADNVLRTFVATLREACQGADIIRWQDNLFLVLLRGRPLSQLALMMEAARTAMLARTLRLRGTGEPIGAVTLSAGIATGQGVPMAEVLKRAEAFRAIATAGQGNRVVSRA